MKITKLEQAGFILEADNGYKLAIDIAAFTPLDTIDFTVDAVLVSHLHGDHFSPEHIKKLSPKKLFLSHECIDLLEEENMPSNVIKIMADETFDFDGIEVTPFSVDHGPNATMVPKENFGFLIKIDGQQIYFAGDMFYPSGMDVTNLEVDYALIPVGGHYTFGPTEAIDFVSTFKSIKKIIPMHYDMTPETREEFAELAIQKGFNVDAKN